MTTERLFAGLCWAGVRLRLDPDGRIHVRGQLTDAQRQTIREHRDLVVARLRLDQEANSGHSLGTAGTIGD